MRNITYLLIGLATATLVLAIVARFYMSPDMIFGVGTRGYIIATAIFLLYSANFAILELLNKK